MAAPIGNEYYKLRSKDGRDKKFETPEELMDAANLYFEWVLDNPFKEDNIFHAQGKITHGDTDKMRPMNLEGLCNFIDLSVRSFRKYMELEDFVPITTRMIQIIDTHQFEGAASGFLNPSIIARKLGLRDGSDVIIREQPLFPKKED